mgnify:CR=1 FL=1
MITAHSGADGTKENSLEFVAYAMQTGADALEVDVRMGENGILILSHDKTDEDAVRLADVFRMMGKYPGMRINCDLKECGLEVAVRQLALISGLKTEQILYSGSVRPVPVTESCIWRDVEVFWNIEEYLPDEKIATEEFIRVTGENDIDLSVWTVNDEERFRELLGQGVKNITTRNVKMACEVRSCEKSS